MSDIGKARRLFERAGLGFPSVPAPLAAELKELDTWLFATRKLRLSPYNLRHYVYDRKEYVGAYAILSHTGHGINSYAIQYYFVYGPVRVFLHLAWGGAYSGVGRGAIPYGFGLADKIVTLATAPGRLEAHESLTIVGSDFYGGYWWPPRRDLEELRLQSEEPVQVLTCPQFMCQPL